MAGNPTGLQQNPTEQQTAWGREPETPDTTVVVPEVHPEPQQPESDKQQAASGEAVTEVHRSMDSRTDKSPEPLKAGRGDKKQQNKAPGHRSTKPDPSQGAIPKIPNEKLQYNENTLEDVQCPFQDAGEASTEMEQDDMIGNFFSNISKHTENLGRKRLLESVFSPPTTNKK